MYPDPESPAIPQTKKPLKKRVLITGDQGFIGAETKKALDPQFEVIPYDIMDKRDIRDLRQLDYIFGQYAPDYCIHLAAIARFADADRHPKLALETNVLGTRNIVSVCKKYHIPLIYASTGSVYMPIQQDPPITEEFKACGNSVYGSTKFMGEEYVREHTPHMILRYAHLYGKEKRMHGLIGGYMDRIQKGLKPQLYGGKQSNDFCYIKDVSLANYLALMAPWDKWDEIYNIGTGEELSAEEAGDILCERVGWKGGVEKKKAREVDPSRFVYDISKARTMLDYAPRYTFKKGIMDMFSEK